MVDFHLEFGVNPIRAESFSHAKRNRCQSGTLVSIFELLAGNLHCKSTADSLAQLAVDGAPALGRDGSESNGSNWARKTELGGS